MSGQTQTIHYRARRAILWGLYRQDVIGGGQDALVHSYELMQELEEGLPDMWSRVERSVRGVLDELETLDAEIQALSPRWRLKRMAVIDRNILRLGAWTLLQEEGRPVRVINDCIELAKEYGERGTPAFVNGLLDQLRKNHEL